MLILTWASCDRTEPLLHGAAFISLLCCALGFVPPSNWLVCTKDILPLACPVLACSPHLALPTSSPFRAQTRIDSVPLPLCHCLSSCIRFFSLTSHNGSSKRRRNKGLCGAPLLALLLVQGKEHPGVQQGGAWQAGGLVEGRRREKDQTLGNECSGLVYHWIGLYINGLDTAIRCCLTDHNIDMEFANSTQVINKQQSGTIEMGLALHHDMLQSLDKWKLELD